MQGPFPLTRELVLIGGGHTHALVLRRWGMNPLPGARLTLINPGPEAPYTGMLPGFVAGHYDRDDLMIDLVRLTRFAGARLVLGAAKAIDPANRRIHVPGRHPIHYDVASINIGVGSGLPDLPGFSECAVAAKPLEPFAAAWLRFRAAVLDGSAKAQVAVIGGGVGGVELSLAISHAVRSAGRSVEVTIIEMASALPGLGTRTRAALLTDLDRHGIRLIEGVTVSAVEPDVVALSDGNEVRAQFTVGVAGSRPQSWLASTGLDLTRGFVAVDATLRSSDPNIYAAGDCAMLPTARPKAGVYAVRQAPVLHHNLRAALSGNVRRTYRPQRDFLKLISCGGKTAIADKYGGRLTGRWIWGWKDRIDRRFMDNFHDLPARTAPNIPTEYAQGFDTAVTEKALCGGCGAKIAATPLAETLAALPRRARDDIMTGPGEDAAVLGIGEAMQVVTTDHLRAFTEDPWTMSRIAAIHSMGDIWAMGARPQAAFANVILPRLSESQQRVWLAEIMAAASDAFMAAGAEIAGGHSSLGSELTIGFTVTGLLERPAIMLDGAKPGDRLVLTKPIGSGTVLAAEMAMEARGDWTVRALGEMERPQGHAAEILHDANAMTDVTGFGLAGHLMDICSASKVTARLDLSKIPLLDGAKELSVRGVRSTLHYGNRKIASRMLIPETDLAELLFDPQTAGGLLASVPPDTTHDRLLALRNAGYPAAGIGWIVEGPPFIEILRSQHDTIAQMRSAARSSSASVRSSNTTSPHTATFRTIRDFP